MTLAFSDETPLDGGAVEDVLPDCRGSPVSSDFSEMSRSDVELLLEHFEGVYALLGFGLVQMQSPRRR